MRPAPAIGVTLDGRRAQTPEDTESLWRQEVEYGELHLVCDWPAGIYALKGAVCAALGVEGHVDFHGHGPQGEARQARATLCYRHGPRLWAYGPRAHAHLQAAGRIEALSLPEGRRVEVTEAHLRLGRAPVGIGKEDWHTYRLASPYFPPRVSYERRPRHAGAAQDAWASHCLARSLGQWLADLGLQTSGNRSVGVHLLSVHHRRLQWRGRAEAVVLGFEATFVSNVALPPGAALGQHVSEGYGEVRPA